MITRDIVLRMKDGHLVQHYLMASYAYYIEHHRISPMTDDVFDLLCKRLLERFDHFEHQHKHVIKKDSLAAGTGYYLKENDYPLMCRHAVIGYLEKCESGEIVNSIEPYLNPPIQQQLF